MGDFLKFGSPRGGLGILSTASEDKIHLLLFGIEEVRSIRAGQMFRRTSQPHVVFSSPAFIQKSFLGFLNKAGSFSLYGLNFSRGVFPGMVGDGSLAPVCGELPDRLLFCVREYGPDSMVTHDLS